MSVCSRRFVSLRKPLTISASVSPANAAITADNVVAVHGKCLTTKTTCITNNLLIYRVAPKK